MKLSGKNQRESSSVFVVMQITKIVRFGIIMWRMITPWKFELRSDTEYEKKH